MESDSAVKMIYHSKIQRQHGERPVSNRFYRLILISLLVIVGISMFSSCDWRKKQYIAPPEIPYPDQRFAEFLQMQVDSLRFMWFTDVKEAASSFCNDQVYNEGQGVSTDSIIVLGESLFHARAEAHLGKRTIILTMERPFKDRGLKSIWQVIKLEDKEWPPSKSR
jgi:hypothetical protein